MEDNRKLKNLISKATELAQLVIMQHNKISEMLTAGKDTSSEESKLNDMITETQILTSTITNIQNSLLEDIKPEENKHLEQPVGNAQITNNFVHPSKKVKKITTKDLFDLTWSGENLQRSTQINRKQNEFTVNQIEAAGLSKNYLNNNIKKLDPQKNKAYVCVWHPWKQAYEICNYCHKPFCFKDIIENNGKFYCLEDVNKTPSSNNKIKHDYSSLSMLSGISLMSGFILFIYFGYSQLTYQSKNLFNMILKLSKGIIVFSPFANFANLFPILAFILTFVGLLVGISILLNTKRSFVTGIFTSAISVIIFSYAYLTYLKIYILLISILSFASMVILLSSKKEEYKNIEKTEELDYTNVNLSNIYTY